MHRHATTGRCCLCCAASALWQLSAVDVESDPMTSGMALEAAVLYLACGLAELRAAPQNTEHVVRQLEHATAQWRFARADVNLADASRFVPTAIVTTRDSLLRKTDRLTGDFRAVSRRRSLTPRAHGSKRKDHRDGTAVARHPPEAPRLAAYRRLEMAWAVRWRTAA